MHLPVTKYHFRYEGRTPNMCLGTTGVVLCKSCDVKIGKDAAGVFNTEAEDNGVVGGKKGYIYLSPCDLIHILPFVG